MEAIEEVPLGSKEPSQIIKGKRTKRIRPQSPPPVSITANSSTAEGDNEDCYNNHKEKYDINSSSPATSVAVFQDSAEEDEDMANCLILLAQGPSRKDIADIALVEDEDGVTNYAKHSSRKFMEAAALGSGKAGYYVYECKTCNRTFLSFQALGGHRASHKKLKTVAMDNEEEFQFKNKIVNIHNNNPFSLQLNSRGNLEINKNSKVHECSICGAEFTSGQALGGHMRRHRAPVAANTMLSLTPLMAMEAEEEQARKRRNIVSLDLDLNLPAPEDDQRESKFGFTSKQQQQQEQQQQQQQPKQPQQHVNPVFSAPSLVDCHY